MDENQYVETREYYEDLYDLFTIKECLRLKNKNQTRNNTKGAGLHNFAKDFLIYFIKGDRYKKRESVINSWIDRDQEKQDFFDHSEEPLDVECLECNSSMFCIHKILEDYSDKDLKVLYMFECSKCGKRRCVYENAEPKEIKPDLCDKCSNEVKRTTKRRNNVITIKLNCKNCGWTDTEKLDLNEDSDDSKRRNKEVERDKKLLQKYRKVFCLSKEEGDTFLLEQENLERFTALMEQQKKNEVDPVYKKMKKIKKLKINEVEKLLSKSLRKEKYRFVDFKEPDIKKYVTVSFTIQDESEERDERHSEYDLKKFIKRELKMTNWRLMSDGISYRLGYLSGRLKGYELEEDLYKLAKQLKS